MNYTATITAALLTTATAAAQDLGHKAPPQDTPLAITNATIHTATGDVLESGYLVFENGVITSVGSGAAPSTDGARVINAAGMHVYPGLIGPITELGLIEFNLVPQSDDRNERGRMSPEATAWVAVNPDSTLLPVTRANGVLLAHTMPAGGDIPGTSSVIRLDGWTNDDMAVRKQAGLVVNWPSMRPSTAFWVTTPAAEQLRQRDARINRIATFFSDAKAYDEARDAEESGGASIAFDIALESARPCFDETNPARVFLRVADLDQITASVTWAVNAGLKPVIIGGRDADLCAELLKAHNVPVIIDGLIGFPKRADLPYEHAYTLPNRLDEAGILWCLGSGERDGNERNLPHHASFSVAFGLDQERALRGLTLSAAEIFGIADTYGSIENGKSATLLIADGTIFEVTTTVTHAFIDGREIDLSNKQTELRDKYREKYRQLGVSRDQ